MSPKLENIKTYMTYIVKILENTSMQVNQITQTCAITTNFKLPKPYESKCSKKVRRMPKRGWVGWVENKHYEVTTDHALVGHVTNQNSVRVSLKQNSFYA